VSAVQSANIANIESRRSVCPVPDPIVSRNAIRETIRKALNLHVGRGRRYTVKELSNATGVPDRIIESAKLEPDDPDFRPLREEYLASVGKFLGASFVSAWLEVMGLGAFELMEGQAPLPHVLTSAPPSEDVSDERKRLIRRLAELEGVQ
jgi:hypothetical protein